MSHTEESIQSILGRVLLLKNHTFVVPNKIIARGNEADLISVNKSNYLNEFEIKISKADFKNESKHKSKKHDFYNTSKPAKFKPNYYWFACPEGIIDVEEVDVKYGLIYVTERNYHVVKRPKLLHRRKFDNLKDLQSITRSLSFKIFNRYVDLLKD